MSVSAHMIKLALRYGNIYFPFPSASFDRCAYVTKLALRYGNLHFPFPSARFDRCAHVTKLANSKLELKMAVWHRDDFARRYSIKSFQHQEEAIEYTKSSNKRRVLSGKDCLEV